MRCITGPGQLRVRTLNDLDGQMIRQAYASGYAWRVAALRGCMQYARCVRASAFFLWAWVLLKRQGHLPGVRGKAFAPGPEDQAFVTRRTCCSALRASPFPLRYLLPSLGLLELWLEETRCYDPCLVPWPKGGQSARIYSSF